MAAAPLDTRAGTLAVTRAVADPAGGLFAAAPRTADLSAFVTDDHGLVGWGRHAAITVTGPDAAARIAEWFEEVSANWAGIGGTDAADAGPVAFVSLGFGPEDESVAVVPQQLLRLREGRCTLTTIGSPGTTPAAEPMRTAGAVSYTDSTLSVGGYMAAVEQATRRIRAGELAKVVLSHDLVATTEFDVDLRMLLTNLAADYPTCYTFAVDGLVGASPELLLRRRGTEVLSRVLAGTNWAEHSGDQVSAELLASTKDQEEHAYSVASVVEALGRLAPVVEAPSAPTPLVLANLTHLATDVRAVLPEPTATAPMLTALELADALHPTGAIGGTPTAVALQLIRELEPTPRSRYAAPVGWIDATGDGEFALALRCAEVTGNQVRMIAGGGIVADSDPEREAREAQVKMIPIRDALER